MKLQVDRTLIRLQYLTVVGIVMVQVLGLDGLSSALFTGTFLLTVAIWLVGMKRNIGVTGLIGLCIVGISCISVLANMLQTNTILSFSYLKKMIMFWATILLFDAMHHYTPDKKTVRLIFTSNSLLAVYLIAMYYVMPESVFVFKGRVTNYLTFHFTNPNLTGVFLSCICILELLSLYLTKGFFRKLVHLVLSGYMLRFVFETGSRNCILIILLFLFVYLVTIVFHKARLHISKKMAVLISVGPLLFAAAYMAYIYMPWIQAFFEFFSGKGKELDSRVTIWAEAFRNVAASPLIGAYNQISEGTGMSQLHNTHIDVMASYGIPVLILLCVFLYRLIAHSKQDTNMNAICLVGFCAVLMSGIGEAMLFSGGQGIYIYAAVLLMLVNYCFENKGLAV